jgi:hypothetical protein
LNPLLPSAETALGRLSRILSAFLLAAASGLEAAEPAPPDPAHALAGTVAGGVYSSPTGAFKIEVPVLAELGGVIRDTNNVVTFHDGFGLQISIGAFVHDATLRWQLSTRGTKDYLVYFFKTYVLEDFKKFCPGTETESAGFSPDLFDGSLFTFILLPGGSVFYEPPAFGPPGTPPVAKRGNLLFIKNGVTFVISTELSERVTEGSRYNKSQQEEDGILRKRLQNIASNMQFTIPATPK